MKIQIDIKEIKKLVNEGKTFNNIAILLNTSLSSIRRICKINNITSKYLEINKSEILQINCLECNNKFTDYKKYNRKFCSKSCSVTYNNKLKVPKLKNLSLSLLILDKCNFCNNDIKGKYFCNKICHSNYCNNLNNKCKHCNDKIAYNLSYCSIKCQQDYILNYKVNNKIASIKILKRYLIQKHGEKCMKCGWDEINIYTNKIPIEIDHIDGNSENNDLTNLRLLCPNCHSLTPTYKGANRGNGRFKRMQRFHEGKSY